MDINKIKGLKTNKACVLRRFEFRKFNNNDTQICTLHSKSDGMHTQYFKTEPSYARALISLHF